MSMSELLDYKFALTKKVGVEARDGLELVGYHHTRDNTEHKSPFILVHKFTGG